VLSVEIKRGFAFVKFETKESAQDAIDNLNNESINGRNIRVNFSKSEPYTPLVNERFQNHQNNHQLQPQTQPQSQPQPQRVPFKENSIHVTNLPYNITEETLREEFEEFGVVSVHLIRTRICFAIIELGSQEAQLRAIDNKNNAVIEGREITVSRQFEGGFRSSRGSYGRGRGRGRGYRRPYRGFRRSFRGNGENQSSNFRGRGFRSRGSFQRGQYSRGFGRGRYTNRGRDSFVLRNPNFPPSPPS